MAEQSIVNHLSTIISAISIGLALFYYRRHLLLYRSIIDVLNNVSGGIIIATRRQHIVLCNRMVADTLGLIPVRAGEPQNFDMRDNAVLAALCSDLFDTPLSPDCEARSFEIVDQHGNYHRWDRHFSSYRINGRDLPAVLLADRTELERLTLRLEQSNTHDPLTGLVNRDIFHDRFGQALEVAARGGTLTGVLVIEIDGFDEIQKEAGWEAAKRAVIETAARLQATTRGADTLARIGEGGFAVLLTSVGSVAAAAHIAERFLKAANHPATSDAAGVEIRCSVGIATAPRDGSTSIRLLDRATRACTRARHGAGGITVYNARLDEDQDSASLTIVADMRRAFEAGEFHLEYQPIVDLATHRPMRCEALLRWQHPEKGLMPPAEFIPIAEQAGIIHRLGDFAFKTACRDAAAWPAGIGVSVNASVVELLSGEWPLHLCEMLARAGLVTERLSIEITETSSIVSLDQLASVTRQLRRLGIGVLLDDFGTGHSSLSQLSTLEFDGLKIDRHFIEDLHDPRCAEIVRMLAEFCGQRGAMTIAEGVETAEQAAQLHAMGCTHAQGYYFGRPMPHDDLLVRLCTRPAGPRIMKATAAQ